MDQKVQLDPAGAGLPAMELWVSRFGFGILRFLLNRRRTEQWLRKETARVLAIANALSPEQLQAQVLVPRPAGLEDSSRNWSAAMVLQHLVIVDSGIGELITVLAQNQAFGQEVRIADVKPDADAGREQLELLEQALQAYIKTVTAVESLKTEGHHAHPWFGPLNGHGWNTLAALHTMIHRRQLEAIVRQLVKSA